MLQILSVCGNGMGTSTILKINIRKICAKHHINANVESCSFGEALSYLSNTDIIITSPEWAKKIPHNEAVSIQVKNLVDNKLIEEKLLEVVQNQFPDEIKK